MKRLLKGFPVFVFLLAAVTVAALAAGGSQSDPLVTLSYLEETYTDELMKKADDLLAERNAELTEAGSNAAYRVVEIKKGQILKGQVGTEVMLRLGTAKCVAVSNPGLIDTTSGETLAGGKALAVNHLYLMTIEGRGVEATADTATLLVRGAYTIQ